MERDIVKMPRSHGDVLTRMKNQYVRTGAADGSFRTILVPSQEALQMKTHGGEYAVSDLEATSDVFTSFSISVVPASGIPSGSSIHDDAVINQAAANVEKVDDLTYRVKADFSAMVQYASDDPAQAALGEFYWLGLAINTGESTIVGLFYNGMILGESDVADATSLGLSAGSFVLWMKLDEGGRTILLGNGDKATAVTIEVVNTETV